MEILKFNELPPLSQQLLTLLLSNQKQNLELARMQFLRYLREKHNDPNFLADIALPKSDKPIKKLKYKGLDFYVNPNRKRDKAWRRFQLEARAFFDSFMPQTPFPKFDLLYYYFSSPIYNSFKSIYSIYFGDGENVLINWLSFDKEIQDNWQEFIMNLLESFATYPTQNKNIVFKINICKNMRPQIENLPKGYLDFFANKFEPFAKKLFPQCSFSYDY